VRRHGPSARVRLGAGPLAGQDRHGGRERIPDRRQRIGFSALPSPAEIPWGDLGVDVVLECTGKFLNHATLDGHLKRGAKRVIVAAPVKEPDVLNVVVGVNHQLYDPAKAPDRDRCLLHHQLPRPRGEGRA
jgi:glyceraldehyde-3-phosphate dehydrogenase/erythrose-4-phosphate dehydrogenase